VGNYAYVAAHNSGLQILDISDPTRPTSIGGKEIWSSGSVYVAGNHAYIGAWYGLNILDVSNPVEPAMKGNYRLTNDGVSDVHVLDGYAYSSIEPASHHVPSFISIIDVRDPTNPDTVGDRIGGYRIGGYGEDDIRDIYGFHVKGNYLYILAHAYVDGKAKALHIVDVQDRANPSLVSNITMTSAAHEHQSDIQVVGSYAYVAGSSLQVVNISDPTNPTLVAGIETPGDDAGGIDVVDGYAYITSRETGLQVVNVQDPTAPFLAATYDISGTAVSVHVVGEYAYVANKSAGLQILRVTPAAPADPAQGRERCFEETGYCVQDPILAYWEQNGGLPVFGYPISERRTEQVENQTLPVQWFERDRLEDHGAVGVLAGRLGARLLELQGRPWETLPTVDAPAEGCRYFGETRHMMCEPFLSYWEQNGGLERFGYPISETQEETLGDWTGTVQYFERRRMEHHPEHAGTEYEVLLGLLGKTVLETTTSGS
jgi:hypothetical protein